MKKKPSIYATLFTSTDDEALLFDRWFSEHESNRMMEAAVGLADEPCAVDLRELELARGDYDANIEVGQVRILSKRFTETPDVVPFVVVLEKWEDRGGDDMWLVAPFSEYSVPATSGEMVSGEILLWREVIQVWNARTVQSSLLKKSFLCGELGKRSVDSACALFRNQLAGTPLPADFSTLRGSDIVLEADPRRDYQAEEIARLRPLSTAVKAIERIRTEAEKSKATDALGKEFAKRIAAMIAKTRVVDEEMKLASGTRKPRTKSYAVGDVSLDLEFSPEAESVVMTFYDEDDKKFLGYDGYGVLGADDEFLGTFKGGSVCVPAEAVRESFLLVDSDGEPVSVDERE